MNTLKGDYYNYVENLIPVSVPFANRYTYYKIMTSNAQKYRIESTGNYDTYIYSYTSDGTLIKSNDDGGNNRNFALTIELASDKSYYLKAGMYGSNTGEYGFPV